MLVVSTTGTLSRRGRKGLAENAEKLTMTKFPSLSPRDAGSYGNRQMRAPQPQHDDTKY